MTETAAESRFLAPAIRPEEDELERSLRPRRLGDFVGQARVKEQLAIALDDAARFEAIPGIGRKTAQRIVLELKEKLAADVIVGGATDATARDALVELGYTLVEAERALAAVDPELPAEERVRQALKKAA